MAIKAYCLKYTRNPNYDYAAQTSYGLFTAADFEPKPLTHSIPKLNSAGYPNNEEVPFTAESPAGLGRLVGQIRPDVSIFLSGLAVPDFTLDRYVTHEYVPLSELERQQFRLALINAWRNH